MIRYEHPLNERVRTLMRLEDLFARVGYFAAQDAAQDHHAALLALFEITDVAARADLKTDLLQELERQKQMLAPLRQNPQIEQRTLEELLAQIDGVNAQLLAQAGKVGVAPARQRVADGDQAAHGHSRRRLRVRPAGLPLVAAPGPGRAAQRPAGWIEPFAPIRAGSAIVLKLLRDNGRASRHTAYRGVFQLMLTTTKVAQLLRLTVAHNLSVRAGDQRQQVRAQHPLPRRVRHGPRRGVRPRRRVRADVLQSLT